MDFTLQPALFSFVSIIIASVSGDEGVADFTVCSKTFDCGTKTNLSYPFWADGSRSRECGHPDFELSGCAYRNQHPILIAVSPQLRLIAVNQFSKILTVALKDLWNTTCPSISGNTTLSFPLLQFAPPLPDPGLQNLILFYGCSLPQAGVRIPTETTHPCPNPRDSVSFYVNETSLRESWPEWLPYCEGSVEIPIPTVVSDEVWGRQGERELQRVLDAGFNVSYSYGDAEASCDQCGRSDGLCGTATWPSTNFLCHCLAGSHPLACPASGEDEGSKNTRRLVYILVAVAGAAVTGVCFFCSWWRILMKKRSRIPGYQQMEEVMISDGAGKLVEFDFDAIRAATNNFEDGRKLGRGGFGAVYKGTLPNGQEIAVKRLSRHSRQGDLEFKTEGELVAKLQHRNLVRFLGFCLKGKERLLIFEFVPNASLDHIIFDPNKRAHLDWERRHKIIGGIARGLVYLHEDSRLRIIHRDLKAGNILLDAEMNPKIADFGLARLFDFDETEGITRRVVGTYGYMAPEYLIHGNFSIKSDVFSFGVLVLEIVSGQRNKLVRGGSNVEDLLTYAWKSWKNGTHTNLVDASLGDDVVSGVKTIMRCIHIGLLCVQKNVDDRPTMSFVAQMLTNYSLALPQPSKPAFFMQAASPGESQEEVLATSNPQSWNEVSMTELCPR